jgi:hypothetical protein
MTRRSSARAQAQEIYRAMAIKEASLGARLDTPLPNPPPQGGREQAVQGGREQDLTARVRALYEGSAVPVREIANLAGITERTLYKYAAKQQWKPRYRWRADGGRPRWRRWRASPERAPAKGAGGRFIARAGKDAPVARGIKATDPAAAARAGAACGQAARQAQEAERQAAAERNAADRLRAMAAVNKALDDLAEYLEQRDKRKPVTLSHPDWPSPVRPRPAPGEDPVETAFRDSVGAANDWWRALQAEAAKI